MGFDWIMMQIILQLTGWETRSMSRASWDFVSSLKFPFIFFGQRY